jgi:hypothetical protein
MGRNAGVEGFAAGRRQTEARFRVLKLEIL